MFRDDYESERDPQQELANILSDFLYSKKYYVGQSQMVQDYQIRSFDGEVMPLEWAEIEMVRYDEEQLEGMERQLASYKAEMDNLERQIRSLIPKSLYGKKLQIHHQINYANSRKILLTVPEQGPIEVSTNKEI